MTYLKALRCRAERKSHVRMSVLQEGKSTGLVKKKSTLNCVKMTDAS